MSFVSRLSRSCLVAALAAASVVVGGAGCGKRTAACSGTERCACYPNGTCNTGLSCFSNVCVNSSDGGSDRSVSSGAGGGTGGGNLPLGTGGGLAGTSGTGGEGGEPTSGSGGGMTAGGGAGGAPIAGTGGGTLAGAGGGPTAGTGGGPVSGTGGGVTTGTGGAPVVGTGGAPAVGTGGGPGAGTGGGAATGTGGAPAVGTGGGPVAGTGGSALPGTGGSGGPSDAGTGSDALCRVFEVSPEATAPTVFLLVDRSGSMFQPVAGGGTTWSVLRTGALKVVQDLQSVVRFGFGAFVGMPPAMCPIFDKVGAALDNYNPIAAAYNGLGAPAFKAETPTVQVLQQLRNDILGPDPSPGPKYILFVTDGQPDYCNDGNQLCPVDGVVRELQLLKAQGITTLVFGIASSQSTISEQALKAFANAGAGQSVQPAIQTFATTDDIYFQCMGEPQWMATWTAAGKTGRMPLGDYGPGGNATVYRPDPTNEQALTDLLATTISGVKSCTFDLANGLSVDLGQLDRVSVVVAGTDIPHDATNGWSMASATRLVLSGTSCTTWRQPTTRTIDFRFPCGVIQGS